MAKSTSEDQRLSEGGSKDSQQGVSKLNAVISRRRAIQAGIGVIGVGALTTSGSEPALAAEGVSFDVPANLDPGATVTVSSFTVSWQELETSNPIRATVKAVPSSGEPTSTSQDIAINSPSGETQTSEMTLGLPEVGFDNGVEMALELSHPDTSEPATTTAPDTVTVEATAVTLTWSSSSEVPVDGFYVYRATVDGATFNGGSSDFTEIAEVSSGTTTYTDSEPPVGADATVSYVVTAFNSAGESSPAGPVEL